MAAFQKGLEIMKVNACVFQLFYICTCQALRGVSIHQEENLHVSLSLDKSAKKVTYSIIDGLGRFVSQEVHNGVKEETFDLNISRLASGSYYLVVNTDERIVARKFVVAK